MLFIGVILLHRGCLLGFDSGVHWTVPPWVYGYIIAYFFDFDNWQTVRNTKLFFVYKVEFVYIAYVFLDKGKNVWYNKSVVLMIWKKWDFFKNPIDKTARICYNIIRRRKSVDQKEYGSVPERPKGADCKSVVTDFGGPNPPAPTRKKHIA